MPALVKIQRFAPAFFQELTLPVQAFDKKRFS
jgi:hypothetical protein